jgi:hypothetical protein
MLATRGGEAEPRLGEVAFDRQHAFAVPAHARGDRVELLLRAGTHQHVHRALALEQVGDEEAAQEPGPAGDEIAHVLPRP